ncbi:MAG TPA: TM2 domain-containing protein [Candidatus Eubacterium faecipullorum]|uniref:TM2 domain-containing protein n=1 Tax=Candidatus Eubacterium faecipullorum TaxID=2838571 RepID=A0A9D1RGS7_9FIRM|nr:TM2 domain-containing protein [Candidatus Eubacterium faecipullorum]
MYCKNCGIELNENAAVCVNCGAAKGMGGAYCQNCGQPVHPGAAFCLNCGAALAADTVQTGDKSKVAAGLLAIFLGHLGIHWFYLKFNAKGIINIVLTLVCLLFTFLLVFLSWLTFLGLAAIWVYNIVIAIKIFTGKQKDADGKALR